MNARPTKRRNRLRNGIIAALCTLAIAECLSYGVGKFLQRKWCMYGPPRDPAGKVCPSYAEYLTRRDPRFGWPYPDQAGTGPYDAFGARPSPAFPDTTPDTSQIALYGDSFTQSPNSDEDAWGNVLARLSQCRVSNYGQGGYGSDQAYLRYLHSSPDHATVVILSHLSENIVRNLTRNRDLLTYERWYAYKPRFVLDSSGKLQLVPLPTLTLEEHLRLEGNASPPLLLEYEPFCPGGPAGATLLRFPFTLSLARNFGDFRARARLARRPYYAEFYERGHPLDGLNITREICRAFVAEARRRGQSPLVLLLPTKEDLTGFRRTQQWTYANLVQELESVGVEFIDFGPTLAKNTEGRPADEIFDGTGHFRPETDKLLTTFVFAAIQRLPAWETLRKP